MDERDILSAIPYENNSVVLHTDVNLLPKSRRAWSSWNYRIPDDAGVLPSLTYNMNILQGLDAPHTFCVSLNSDDLIDEGKVIAKFNYAHPQFSLKSAAAQAKRELISGENKTWYCGAYWANGFHEDGLKSAKDLVESFSKRFDNA